MNKIFDYSELTLSQMIEKISTARFFHLPKMVAEALRKLSASPSYTPPYKVYTAIINQSGTNIPTLIVLENTLNITLTPTRNNIGEYTFSLGESRLNLLNTTIDISNVKFTSNPSTSKASYTIIHNVDYQFQVFTHQAGNSTWNKTDDNFRNNKLEIRVYN